MKVLTRHLSTLTAVVLALATGIALGAGPLAAAGKEALRTDAPVRSVVQRPDHYGDQYAAATARRVLGSSLGGQTVSLLVAPGADQRAVAGLRAMIGYAGGRSTVWNLGDSLVSGNETALVDTLGQQMIKQSKTLRIDPALTAYPRMGRLIARSVATVHGTDVAADQATADLRASLSGAELMRGSARQGRASAVVLVLGRDVNDDVLAGLLSGLAPGSATTVVVAPGRAGDLAVASDVEGVATVDSIDRAESQVATVLAIAQRVQDGDFGASGTDGPAPLG